VPRRLLLSVLVLVFAAAPGGSRRKARDPSPEPPDAVPEAPPRPEVTDLFPDGLPVDLGRIPEGLANLSAQGCNACHYGAHDGWAASTHAVGWTSAAFRDAVEAAQMPACKVCHLPLAVQSPDQLLYLEGAPNDPDARPNLEYDATLHAEGVTCAACHIRDGQVVGARPEGEAPHPVAHSPSMRTSAFCAPCHQLTWPGADRPLYDTFGEWERSPQGRAGIQCQDCHMGPGAGAARLGPNHAFPASPARAVSLLLHLDGVDLVRGGDPLVATIRLQNTGAGHAFPTGSPFRAVQMRAALVGPPAKEGEAPTEASVFTVDLGRTLEAEPPFRTVEDTRLGPGGERSWSWEPRLDLASPGGEWRLEVTLTEVVRGAPSAEPFLVRWVPLRVD